MRCHALSNGFLFDVASLVIPDTLVAWHRRLVPKQCVFPTGGQCNAAGVKVTTGHMLRMASENPIWGYDHIHGALPYLGHTVARNTTHNILRRNGTSPASERGKQNPWITYLNAHALTILYTDSLTTEV